MGFGGFFFRVVIPFFLFFFWEPLKAGSEGEYRRIFVGRAGDCLDGLYEVGGLMFVEFVGWGGMGGRWEGGGNTYRIYIPLSTTL